MICLMLEEIRAWKASREALWSPRPEGMEREWGGGIGLKGAPLSVRECPLTLQ